MAMHAYLSDTASKSLATDHPAQTIGELKLLQASMAKLNDIVVITEVNRLVKPRANTAPGMMTARAP